MLQAQLVRVLARGGCVAAGSTMLQARTLVSMRQAPRQTFSRASRALVVTVPTSALPSGSAGPFWIWIARQTSIITSAPGAGIWFARAFKILCICM